MESEKANSEQIQQGVWLRRIQIWQHSAVNTTKTVFRQM